MAQKSRDYNSLLKSANFTSKFLAAYWGERLVRSIIGCATPSQNLMTCLEMNGNNVEKCQDQAMEQEHCVMSYAFPEEYDRFMECFEKHQDPAQQEKACSPLLIDVNNKVMNELQTMQNNTSPLSSEEFKKFEACVTEKGEDGLFGCALEGEPALRQRFDSCMSSNAEDVSKCDQQASELVIAAGKFLKRAGVQL